MQFSPTLLVAILPGLIECAPAAQAANPTVSIASGVVVGTITPVFSAPAQTTTVFNYLGIPFAAPPTGMRRFAPPAQPTPWTSPLSATKFPPACLQQFNYPEAAAAFEETVFNNPAPAESEDCLYLNVFAPTDASSSTKKPVLFWIFGGNLQFGTGSLPTYNGSSFAGFQDVVVVTFNYRTNIFGFSGSPQISQGQQNSGYLDQRLALQWVQKNIASFGGDPTQVTIFGESAGAYSVKQLLAQPPSPLPYRAAILESEGASVTGNSLADYHATLAHFGCTTAVSPIDCLRQVSATDIESYISQNALGFPPIADGMTQTNDVRPNILSKQFAQVPFFLGTNANEGRVFAAGLGLETSNTTAEEIAAMLLPNATVAQTAVLAAYNTLENSPYLLASAIVTDLAFTCTASSLSTFAVANGYHVWRYYYNASFPDQAAFPMPGAYHSSEIQQVFGTYQLADAYGAATPTQEKLSQYMQTAWAQFAKDPASGPGWPRLGTNAGVELADLGGVNAVGETTIPLVDVDYICAIYDPIIALGGF